MVELGPVERRLTLETKKGPICAALIDPEDFNPEQAARTATKSIAAGVSLILLGGSTLASQGRLDDVVKAVKGHMQHTKSRVPIVLFPGNITGVSHFADAILFSSLLNSTNPYFIIGAQALGAVEVYKSKIESIPMAYLVFGNSSATSFIGQVNPIPASKPNLAVIYALAAKYLGMRTLYLEAGSGSGEPIPRETIQAVKRVYDGLLIVGGGITSPEAASKATRAGADILVIGNLLQKPGFETTLERIVAATK
ncbi:MAG: geranylgeranylglyceryl/heptaprenylglyceryl phosphate synthase [Nitrososphaerota archaeon]|nr:geranylgeranylglyceryl/heptaprenylglyceryl phosphate synthase [Nitrososphaerota archaeon]MDG6943005.1 geranylgeranylglyceryl/heptaprenylglyceryl phosphate synthase [Nitrososphaerota archaeon]MDG6950734.1 geranylgeranylglyceryl/heptaprenylglyceryl phosphate synthase [Nitrososphaerota archaeon]